MSLKPCCLTCQHCVLGHTGSAGWCLLRRIKVHNAIVSLVFCHHWTIQESSLPTVEDNTKESEKQLDFGRALI